MDAAKIELLKDIVDIFEENPSLLDTPQLEFYKKFLQRCTLVVSILIIWKKVNCSFSPNVCDFYGLICLFIQMGFSKFGIWKIGESRA